MTEFESICEKCEQLLQPYLDRELDEIERLEAESHLQQLRLLPHALPLRREPAALRAESLLGDDVIPS